MISLNFLKFFIIFIGFLFFVSLNVGISFAIDDAIPNWVFVVQDYWLTTNISTMEFNNALQYLQDHGIIDLVMHSDYDLVSNFLISSTLQQNFDSISFQNCSSDWHITGYFTPVENDYSENYEEITFENGVRYFKSDFLSVVKIEGWGKTMSGDYVGWYDDSFHISNAALDSHGTYLLPSYIAVDSNIIPQNTNLIIPNLPAPWNMIIFKSTDIGPSIIGKHIDVYTGEGKQAELETFRITGDNNDICVEFFEN